jgi:hypothetical protein
VISPLVVGVVLTSLMPHAHTQAKTMCGTTNSVLKRDETDHGPNTPRLYTRCLRMCMCFSTKQCGRAKEQHSTARARRGRQGSLGARKKGANARIELDRLVRTRAHLILARVLAEPEENVALECAVLHLRVQEDVRVTWQKGFRGWAVGRQWREVGGGGGGRGVSSAQILHASS